MATDPRQHPFDDEDRAELARRGVGLEQALAQLDRIRRGSGDVTLDRPAGVGDGIRRLPPPQRDALRARYERARRAGRLTSFVPASGAASRMFAAPLAWRERPGPLTRDELAAAAASGDPHARDTAELLRRLPAFAFAPQLESALAGSGAAPLASAAEGPHRPVLEALLGRTGLDYGRRPKGLVAFHRDGPGIRTALDEHLVDAARLLSDDRGRARLQLTVSPEHEAEIDRWLEGAIARWESRLGVRYEVGRSIQRPSTDTLAAGDDGLPFRGPDGRLMFRPAGHGALLANLADCGADIAFVKNVDNVAAEPWKGPTHEWMPILIGALAELEEGRARALERLNAGPDGIAEAESFLRGDAGHSPAAAVGGGGAPLAVAAGAGGAAAAGAIAGRIEAARVALDRPIRVCGMVEAAGEPGGGPFWVRGRDGGVTPQIVESAQVRGDPEQQAILLQSTHFNPVFMALALRDPAGRPYDLSRFSDPESVIVTRRPAGGRELRALELPGLWNGGMARWLTVFVEVPSGVFTPVKTVLDLLRPEHLPR